MRDALGPHPVGSFDPAGYPGPRPDGPVLVHDGHLHDVEVAGGASAGLRSHVDAPVLDPDAVRWVVAYGSNASPPRLVSKGLDRRGAVLLPAHLDGWAPAFEHRRTGYGAVPLTLVPAAGVRTATWLLGVHVADTAVLDRSEGRATGDLATGGRGEPPGLGAVPDDLHLAPSGAYRLGRVGTVHVAGGWHVDGALAYLPGSRTEVQVDENGGWRTWPVVDQADAAAHVEAGGPASPAPTAPAAVPGRWPRTPLRGGRGPSDTPG